MAGTKRPAKAATDWTRPMHPAPVGSLYEADEHAWLLAQVEVLRSGSLGRLDAVHLAEFLGDMAQRDRREVKSRFKALLHHLLQVTHQPEMLSRHWVVAIIEQQDELKGLLDNSPAMRRFVPGLYKAAYPLAVWLAAAGTGLAPSTFPADNPWSTEQALAFVPPSPPVELADMTDQQQEMVAAGQIVAGVFPQGLSRQELGAWIMAQFLGCAASRETGERDMDP